VYEKVVGLNSSPVEFGVIVILTLSKTMTCDKDRNEET